MKDWDLEEMLRKDMLMGSTSLKSKFDFLLIFGFLTKQG
jgi:hypothetical protein